MWGRERGKFGKLSQNGHFSRFLSKIWLKTPSLKSWPAKVFEIIGKFVFRA